MKNFEKLNNAELKNVKGGAIVKVGHLFYNTYTKEWFSPCGGKLKAIVKPETLINQQKLINGGLGNG